MAIKNVNVRLPDELHALVKASAETDRRSLNSQIVWLLEAGLATSPTSATREPLSLPAGQLPIEDVLS